jgi:hypothetical protein
MDWTQVNAFLQEQVAAAAQGKDGRERDAATAEVLSNLAQPIRQFLHDGGHANATAQHKTKIRTLEAEKSALEEQVTAAQARIEEIEKQAPNAEQIKAQYRQEIEQIKAQHKATAEALEGQIRSLKTGSFTSRLLGQMGPRLSEDGLDWARTQVERMTLDGRIRPTDAPARKGDPVLGHHRRRTPLRRGRRSAQGRAAVGAQVGRRRRRRHQRVRQWRAERR